MNRIEAASLLGILATADAAGVRKAFRAKSLKAHPDKGGSAEAFKKLIQARCVMLDKEERPSGKTEEMFRRWAEAQVRAAHVRGARFNGRIVVIAGGGSTTTTTWSF